MEDDWELDPGHRSGMYACVQDHLEQWYLLERYMVHISLIDASERGFMALLEKSVVCILDRRSAFRT